MSIEERIRDTEREVKHWRETVVKRRKAVRRAEARLEIAQFNVEFWQNHLQILVEESAKDKG